MKTVADLAGPMGSACIVLAIAWFMAQAVASPVCVAQDYGPQFANQPTELVPPPPNAEYFEPIPPPSAPATELIPPPPQPSTTGEGVLPEGCQPAPQTPPLASLTIDVAPRDQNGQLVSDSQLPENCAKYVYTLERFQPFGLSCTACQMSVCELLELANYCHRPLYFEDKALEKCGVRSCCCQPAKSACQFYGGALLLPCKLMRQCPCSTCVPDGPCY